MASTPSFRRYRSTRTTPWVSARAWIIL